MIDAIRETVARWQSLLFKKSADRELSDEFTAHLELAEAEYRKRGLPAREARRQALLEFGGVEAARELHREARGLPWLESLAQDLRYTLRTLKRDLGFTLFAVLIVGLGIGGSTVVFSAVHTLLVRPLPFHDPDRLVWIANGGNGGLSGETVQVNHFLDLRAQNQSLSDLAGYFAFYGLGDSKLVGQGEPERLSTLPVTQNFFPLLGVQPQMGRLFTAEECKWRGPRAVLLSHALWKRRFASDPNMVGRILTMDDGPVPVIGVLPASFDFGSVFAPGTRIDLYAPFPLSEETNRQGNTLALIGRLKPGVSMARARAEVNGVSRQLEKAHRRERNDFDAKLMPLAEHVSGRWRVPLLVLICAVAVVMLIVCTNLSNLLLARTAARQKELAVRTALGAGRKRLIRQLLTESVVLASLGAVFGLALAVAGARALSHLGVMGIPLLDSVYIDGTALAFTLVLVLATGILFGLIPALQVCDVNINDTLKESSRSASEGRRHGWIRKALVISEIAFASMLLVGAGLLARSFLRVLDVNLGFQPESAATMRIDPSSGYSTQAQRNSYFTEALRRVREIPGLRAAALTDALPLGRNRMWGVRAKGKQYTRGNYPGAFPRIISDGYLKAMGVPLIAGREFTEHDLPSSEAVILINQTPVLI
jgi:predicted permease